MLRGAWYKILLEQVVDRDFQAIEVALSSRLAVHPSCQLATPRLTATFDDAVFGAVIEVYPSVARLTRAMVKFKTRDAAQ